LVQLPATTQILHDAANTELQ